jgi:hypothetical protein
MRFLALLLLLVGLAACNSEEDVATVVSCQQLAQRSVRWQEPKVAVWSYQGATNGYHYFHFVDLPFGHYEQYKVPEDEIHIVAPFPFTMDQKSGAFCRGDQLESKPKKTVFLTMFAVTSTF